MQYSSSTSTTPSRVVNVAPTGQTWTHGGLAQWLHSFGTKNVRRSPASVSGAGKPSMPPLGLSTVTAPSASMV